MSDTITIPMSRIPSIPASASGSNTSISRPTSLQHAESTEEVEMTDSVADLMASRPAKGTEAFDSYPDGGLHAWLQVFYCFCILFTTVGGIYLWGIFSAELYHLGLASTSTLAFIGSTQATFEGALAIPVSRLVAAYGCRPVAVAGALLASLGPFLAGWCTKSLVGMFITEAFMFGIGQTCIFFCAATLPSNYFLRRRNMATGLVYAGAGIGGAALAPITTALINRLGLPWAFRIIGILFLAINLPCAWFLDGRRARVPLRGTKVKALDVKLLTDVRFILIALAGIIGVFPIFVPPFFLPLFGDSIGLTSSTSALLLTGYNLASAGGRIGFGLIADNMVGSVTAFFICALTNALSTLVIWPLAGNLVPLAVFAVLNGFCSGGFFSLLPGVMASLFSHDQMPVAFSMLISSFTPGYFLGAPIAGYLLQAFGGPTSDWKNYRPAIFYAGGLSLFSSLVVLAIRIKEGGSWKRKV